MKPYRYIEHTADLGIEVFGDTIEDLFMNLGKAIFQTQISGKVGQKRTIKINIANDSMEELLIDWCRELLYNFAVHGFIPNKYDVSLNGQNLSASLQGEDYDPNKHKMRMEIKNPTYHNLEIKRSDRQYSATIIFDV
jgi:SHS2 domain-containing protein